ncbi:MAG: PaaI family thioesterase [Myxococcaceae bacterium]|nr:PaaI family thioesterase [Myxococcaceae bacterium]
MSSADDFVVDLEALRLAFRDFVPHNQALGLTLLDAGVSPAFATMKLPYDARFAGHDATGVLHGGVITTLLDATCGASVFLKLRTPTPIATLDLRLDYLKPATVGRDVIARAECFKATHNVAFVRALAYHDDANDPIAAAAGTFMLSTPGVAATQRAKEALGR